MGQHSHCIYMAGNDHMDKQQQNPAKEYTKVSTEQIGNTTFTVIEHYSGEQTYLDMVKDVLRREIDNAR